MWHGSMMKPSFSSALISGVVLPFLTTWFSPEQQTGMLLTLQQRGSWGMQETFQALALVSLPPFIPGVANGRICKPAHRSFTWWFVDLCQLCHAHWARALMVLRHCSACVSMAGEGWTTQLSPINPENIGHRVMGWFFNYRRNLEVSK